MSKKYNLNATNYDNVSYFIPYIRYCAQDEHDITWRLKKRTINDYEFIFVTAGEGVFFISDRQYNVKANDLILVSPDIIHSGYTVREPFKFLCLHFDLYIPEGTFNFSSTGMTGDFAPVSSIKYYKTEIEFPEYINIKDYTYLNTIFKKIINEVQKKPLGYRILIKSLFQEIITFLYRQLDAKQTINKEYPEVIYFIKEYIEKNYMKKFYLVDIANLIHFQPSYMSSFFKKNTGINITEYLKRYRIIVSKQMLAEECNKIDNIALQTGFYDIHHFSKVFKELEGLTPSQYRNTIMIDS